MATEDRISKLPREIILRILSFLPTEDVVRTCFLSKSWKLLWCSVPKLSFYNKVHANFSNYIDKFLEHRKRIVPPDSVITSLNLSIVYMGTPMSDCIDKCLDFGFESKIKKLHLFVDSSLGYYLPRSVFNTRSLTKLKLTMVVMHSRYAFDFPSLKSLTLICVKFARKKVLNKLLLGSPSLEKLRFRSYCETKLKINLRSLTLKSLDMKLSFFCAKEVKQIEAPNLELLKLDGVSFNKINRSAWKTIRNLSLTFQWGMKLSAPLEYVISNLPQLQNLTLIDLSKLELKNTKISSQQLKTLTLVDPRLIEGGHQMTVTITSVPRLASFFYKAHFKYDIVLESSNKLDGSFIMMERCEYYDVKWFINLITFFRNMKCTWNTINLNVYSTKALIVPQILRRICRSSLFNWEHLKVFTKCEIEMEADLKESLEWLSPSLKTLSIESLTSCE